jgi:flagellar assembly protein FliH
MTSSKKTPLQAQTAYQRWELASLEEITDQEELASLDALEQAQREAELQLIREEAFQKGLEEGRASGMALGINEGINQGKTQALAEGREHLIEMGKELSVLIRQFDIDANQAREAIANQLLTLAIDCAQAILRSTLTLNPQLLLPLIEEAIHSLPGLRLPATLTLHPEDAKLVETAIGSELLQNGWRIMLDAHLSRGGCRIETGTNEIDLTLESRWKRLQYQLGQNPEWLNND